MDCNLAGTSVHRIFQARILELPFSPPSDCPDPGIKPRSPTLQADSLVSKPPRNPGKWSSWDYLSKLVPCPKYSPMVSELGFNVDFLIAWGSDG